MAILSFNLTTHEFVSGIKSVTRRVWSDKHYSMWKKFWDNGHHIHDAWDNIPRAGGKFLGKFRLTEKPYREKLKDMPIEDLIAEGNMCSSLDEFFELIGKSRDDYVTVLRFEKL